MTIKNPVLPGLALCASLAFAPLAHAAVTEVEGAAGGGIVPWALLAPSTPTVSFTYVNTGDYSLTSLGVSGTVFKRLELSYARQAFNTESVGLGTINVDTFGAKVKLLDMSAMLPQVAVGVMYWLQAVSSFATTPVSIPTSRRPMSSRWRARMCSSMPRCV